MASHPRRAVKACIDCGVPGCPGDGLSWRGLCVDCSIERHAAACRQMAEKRGPVFDRWQASIVDGAREILRKYADAT